MRKIFLLIPSDSPTGPIKGAYVLANSLVNYCHVTIVSLKPGIGARSSLDSRVQFHCLADSVKGIRNKIRAYRNMLDDAGGREVVASLSMCLSADVANLFCAKEAMTYTSVRGNLLANYRYDYGLLGIPLAMTHLFLLRWIDRVVAMNQTMAQQIQRYSGQTPAVIGNFVDEAALDQHRIEPEKENRKRFVFVGSLTQRKQPWLLIEAMAEITQAGEEVMLDVVGSGPLLDSLQQQVERLKLEKSVVFHGFVDQPVKLLSHADAMILPSLSEGISRAALEALHIGVPCVLRDVDSNADLVTNGENGMLFERDEQLAQSMLAAADISREKGHQQSLLPSQFRQAFAAEQYMKLLGEINEQG